MSSVSRKLACWIFFCVIGSASLAGQLLPGQPAKSDANSANQAKPDPLGRDTPNGTVFGFLHAAQVGNYSTAAQYFQMPTAKRVAQGEGIAAKLKVVLDRAYSGDLRKISTQPNGTPQEGGPLDHQQVGVLSAGDIETPLDLVRVSDPSGTRLWLFSSETLSKVPELYEQLQARQIEKHLPGFLVNFKPFDMPLWQWLATLIAIPVAAGIGWLILQLLRIPAYYWRRRKGEMRPLFWSAVSRPLWLILAAMIDQIAVAKYIRPPLLHRHYYQLLLNVAFVTAFTWLLWAVLHRILTGVRQRAIYRGQTGIGTLMILGERILKVCVFILAILVILQVLGFNLTTALAGLGIGGIAIAFAAQKTLENVFAGVSVLGDEVIRVGDVCRIGDRIGTVEDVSLRSTQIRTPERTVLSVPNGSLATMNVENLSRRDKILFNPKLNLRYDASPDQVRYVLAEVRKLFYEHPKVETEGARIRFTGLSDGALTLDVFCYVLTTDGAEFLAIGEDLLLRIMDIIEASGTAWAYPTRLLYISRDHGIDKEKAAAVAYEVQQWRDNNKLPFPDHNEADISEFSNSLPYPEVTSAARSRK
jgi:MscS family membrane protein